MLARNHPRGAGRALTGHVLAARPASPFGAGGRTPAQIAGGSRKDNSADLQKLIACIATSALLLYLWKKICYVDA
jgi:hypothetical protein